MYDPTPSHQSFLPLHPCSPKSRLKDAQTDSGLPVGRNSPVDPPATPFVSPTVSHLKRLLLEPPPVLYHRCS